MATMVLSPSRPEVSPRPRQTGVLFCYKCGRRGHHTKSCTGACVSFGCIWFDESLDHVLVVRHPFTYAFRQILCGPSATSLLYECTRQELLWLRDDSWETNWFRFWGRFDPLPSPAFRDGCRREFLRWAQTCQVSLKTVVQTALDRTQRRSPAWSFPKGRKRFMESDLQCALRETVEETSVDLGKAVFLGECCEQLTGSDGQLYENHYYYGILPSLEIPERDSTDPEIAEVRCLPVNQLLADRQDLPDSLAFFRKVLEQSRRQLQLVPSKGK